MENGHAVDGVYRKDFCWTGKFCRDHDLVTGESRELGAKPAEGVLPRGPMEWIGFVVRVGQLCVSVFPLVSSLGTAYRVTSWGYRIIRLFV